MDSAESLNGLANRLAAGRTLEADKSDTSRRSLGAAFDSAAAADQSGGASKLRLGG